VNSNLGGDGLTNLIGTTGTDSLTGTNSTEYLTGRGGNDTLNGGGGIDYLDGGDGSDTLSGGSGNDFLYGGTGNDTLTGGTGADVFVWTLSDRGTPGTPAQDTVTDFSNTTAAEALNLQDLLVGEWHSGTNPGNLDDYLHFQQSGSNTIVQISSTGGFSADYSAGAVDQSITLNSVDLTNGGALSTDQQIIQDLLSRSKLITD
jgi:surface adhesion protein